MTEPALEPFGLDLMHEGESDFFVDEKKWDRFGYRYDGEKFFEIRNSSDGNYVDYASAKRPSRYFTNRWDFANRQAKMTPYSVIEQWARDGELVAAWARDPKHPENVKVNGRS